MINEMEQTTSCGDLYKHWMFGGLWIHSTVVASLGSVVGLMKRPGGVGEGGGGVLMKVELQI